ncbi:MAG: response regulator transcription factor, partial [Acidobacteria bacterium]|nr:response regulator transcription factor [Acidobacteriota bacterium]
AGIVVDELSGRSARSRRPPSTVQALTSREREVLQLISEGHSAREIAERLHLSVKTVETHRRRLLEKLGMRSVADLTKFAIREGLTSLDR